MSSLTVRESVANGGIASLFQSTRPVAVVAELWVVRPLDHTPAMKYQMHKTLLLLLTLPVILCSCVIPQASMKPVQTSFDEAEFAPYAVEGTSTVTGQAFLKTRGGEVRLGAGNTVKLVPVTSYTTELRRRVTLGGERVGPIDPRIEKYRHTTVADGNGNFEFRNLPAGEYYVTCVITWEVPSQYGLQHTGGVADGTVKVGAGETAKVVVTR